MSLPIIKIILFTGKTYSDGTHPIMLRITKDRKRSYVSVGHSVMPDAWDEDAQRVYEKRPQITKRQEGQLNPAKLSELRKKYKTAIVLPNATHINSVIEDKLDSVSNLAQKLKANEESLEAKNIKSRLKPVLSGDRTKSFLTFAAEFRDKFLKAGSIGTYRRYKSILTKLEEYLKQRDLLFSDITPSFLEDYQNYLASLKNNVNTIHNNLKSIKAIYYSAIAQEVITAEKNPFFIFKLKSDYSVKKEKLTVEEIIAIEKVEYPANSLLLHCKNFFLFSFYCAGIRASDALLLKWSNISSNSRLDYQMEKTGKQKSITLIPKAKAILQQYKGEKNPKGFIFPFLSNAELSNPTALFNKISSSTALVNKYLKEIAKDAGIEKVLSTHIARHSFSDIARKKKASIYDISKMLGHSSIKITEAYLSSLDLDSQDETMKNILDF